MDQEKLKIVEERLRAAVDEFAAAPARALEIRDEEIRAVAAEFAGDGLKQIDIIRITGYSRETVRQALDPEIRAAVKKATEERLAAKKAAG